MNLYDDIVPADASIPDGSTYDEFISALKSEQVDLQHQLSNALEIVSVLERNISCLFATAKLEIKRKDEEITRLRGLVDVERGNAALQQEAMRQLLLQIRDVSTGLIAQAGPLNAVELAPSDKVSISRTWVQRLQRMLADVPHASALTNESQQYANIRDFLLSQAQPSIATVAAPVATTSAPVATASAPVHAFSKDSRTLPSRAPSEPAHRNGLADSNPNSVYDERRNSRDYRPQQRRRSRSPYRRDDYPRSRSPHRHPYSADDRERRW